MSLNLEAQVIYTFVAAQINEIGCPPANGPPHITPAISAVTSVASAGRLTHPLRTQ